MNFADNLFDAIKKKKNPSCAGLDPNIKKIPHDLKRYAETPEAAAFAILEFNKKIIDAVHDIVPAVKPQIAYYEKYGKHGVSAFEETVKYAKNKGLIVIEDAKRNDIGSTAEAYAQGHLGEVELHSGTIPMFDVDCMTVNPYLGIDGIQPFINECKDRGKGIFVLCKTSNPSAGEFQDKVTLLNDKEKEILAEKLGDEKHFAKIRNFNYFDGNVLVPNFILMALNIDKWGKDVVGEKDYSSVGAVVGVTYPEDAEVLRKIMKCPFLGPGYGAQRGGGEDVVPLFNEDGYGAIINSSRGIIFAYADDQYKNKFGPEKFADASRQAAIDMREDITQALRKHRKCDW